MTLYVDTSALLKRYVDRVARLPMPSATVDIDRPEDLLSVSTGD